MRGKVKRGLRSSAAVFAFSSSARAKRTSRYRDNCLFNERSANRLEEGIQTSEWQRTANSRGIRVSSLPGVVIFYAALRPRRGFACSSVSTKQSKGLINVSIAERRHKL